MKKRGISPLIATVLLIAFAIALGAIVMNWGRQYTKSSIERTDITTETQYKCKLDVGIRLYEVNGRKKICINSTEHLLDLMVENGPNVDIQGLHMIIVDESDNIDVITLPDSGIPKAGVKHINYTYNHIILNDDLLQIKLSPIVKINDEDIICKEKALTIEQGDFLPCR
ncbi:hypothetical protein JW968_06015 [Candidatus Woesearchaeota archaeon]|nr:hypothetical protein [Candidatus Woesearchaeota archaeon]